MLGQKRKIHLLQLLRYRPMIKLKISYEHEEDLARVLTVLQPMIVRCRRSGNREGRYKKAYVELECVMKPGESREENGLKQERSPGKA